MKGIDLELDDPKTLRERRRARRRGPRFSVRALAIAVTLFCSYLGFWELTKWGATQQVNLVDSLDKLSESTKGWVPVEAGVPCPFVIWIEAADWPGSFYVSAEKYTTTTYYLWFFGLKLRIHGPAKSYLDPFADAEYQTTPAELSDPFGDTLN